MNDNFKIRQDGGKKKTMKCYFNNITYNSK